ncbi:ELKS/Rab6-interacting/CAST family member 1-like isoform X2 [Tubulanus polymorphus]|uniref:ELKS/Rab6-interacting/CAST family member 1-like isoform X2 n=1 Tax=Tubulanus polymorphus TaxID=672921 RepID=UPI003DA63289
MAHSSMKPNQTLPSHSISARASPNQLLSTSKSVQSRSNHGSRSNSPFQIEASLNSTCSITPNSSSDCRSSTMSNMKSIRRDRSADSIERTRSLVRDRSLDRQLDKLVLRGFTQYSVGKCENSTDREYLKAKTLDPGSLTHSQSLMDYSGGWLSNHDGLNTSLSRDHLDLQSDIAISNHECAKLQQELQLNKDKLSSSMNSIKTFWSPELKKERLLRKEESARYALVSDQLRKLQSDNKHHTLIIQKLEEQLRAGGSGGVWGTSSNGGIGVSDVDSLKRTKEQQMKEILILHKTIEEFELRIETQKQTLTARDESIKKLLEMLQSKGIASNLIDDDRIQMEKLKVKTSQDEQQMNKLEAMLQQRDKTIEQFKQSDHVKGQLCTHESEVCAMQTKLETLEKQKEDQSHHIDILKEQNNAKEQHCLMLTADIENFEEQINEKESQLNSTKACIATMHADRTCSDSTLSNLEEIIQDKEKQIERLKEQRERVEKEHLDEVEHFQNSSQEIKFKCEIFQKELSEKQAELLELRDEISELKSEKYKRDSEYNKMEMRLHEKMNDLITVKTELQKIKEKQITDFQMNPQGETEQRILDLEQQVAHYTDAVSKSHQEVDRLLEIMKEMENEKFYKDKQIKEMQDQLKEIRSKFTSLKRNQQTEKKKNAQLLEEARKREDGISDDSTQLKNIIKQNEERIEELEEALRESVQITAERELAVAEHQNQLEDLQEKINAQQSEIDTLERMNSEQQNKLHSLTEYLKEKENTLSQFKAERRKQLEEVYEMKQEAILAAISEKDATLALLEMSTIEPKSASEAGQLKVDKERLQKQLKELTQNRVKLLHNEKNVDDIRTSNESKLDELKKSSSQQDDVGIWA